MNRESHRTSSNCTKNFNTEDICLNYQSKVTFDNVPIKKLLIANIARQTTHRELKSEFSKYGKIEDCILKQKCGKKKSYGFITYSNCNEAQSAISAGYMKKIMFHDNWVRVIPTVPWNQPDSIENKRNVNKVEEDKVISRYSNLVINESKETIHTLNNDCLLHIFMYLQIADRVRIERVCKRWKAVSEESWHCNKSFDLKPSNWGLVKEIKAPYIYKVLNKCGTHITDIDLSQCRNKIGNASLISIAKLCPNIQIINITGIEHSSSAIKALADNCHNIKKLIMSLSNKENFESLLYPNFPSANDNYIKELSLLFLKNPKLQYLDLVCNGHDVRECLIRLPIKSLRVLRLTNLCNLYYPVVQKLHLEELIIDGLFLNIKNTPITEVFQISSKNLKILELTNTSTVFTFNLIGISEFNNLTTLNLENNVNVDDNFLIKLSSKCRQLLRINIGHCGKVTNSGLVCITDLPKLEVLFIDYLINISNEAFIHMPELQILSCISCHYLNNYAGLSILKSTSEKLKELYICHCRLITDDFIHDALKLTKNRKNNALKVFVHDTSIKKFIETPFLKINGEPFFDHHFDIHSNN